MTLTNEQIEFFRQRLITEKENLEQQIKDLEDDADFGDDTDHLEEETDETEEIASLISIRENFKNRLEKINKALIKIQQKNFGRCESCAQEIELVVLEAVPESEFCQSCKQR